MNAQNARSHAMYTDEQRAQALAALAGNRGNVTKTAAQLGIPRQTLTQWRDGDSKQPESIRALREKAREELAQRFEDLAETLLGVVEAKAKDMSGRDAAWALAVSVDKSLLLRGLATQITEERGAEDEDRAERIRARYLRKLAPVQTDDEPEAGN